jgi:hypothetical protein
MNIFQDWLRKALLKQGIDGQLRQLEEWESFKLDKKSKA